MRCYEFYLSELEIDKFFVAVRDKVHIIEILMESIKYMLIKPEIKDSEIKGKMILRFGKMKRLFFFTENKFFSIIFPFFLKEENGDMIFYSNEISNIDSCTTSQVLGLIKSEQFDSACALEFAEPIYDCDCNRDDLFWGFFKKLLLMEDGYIRYDADPETFKKYDDRGEGDKHPEHHYDVFCSSNVTFKIGLRSEISDDNFIELLDSNSNCKFLS